MLPRITIQANLFFEKLLAFKGLPRFHQRTISVVKNKVLIGWTTVPSKEDALGLARGVVETSLAACAQVNGPISSVYRWKGVVEHSEEWRIVVKFPSDRAAELETWLLKNHPYDEPQWIAVIADEASRSYLEWVESETRKEE